VWREDAAPERDDRLCEPVYCATAVARLACGWSRGRANPAINGTIGSDDPKSAGEMSAYAATATPDRALE